MGNALDKRLSALQRSWVRTSCNSGAVVSPGRINSRLEVRLRKRGVAATEALETTDYADNTDGLRSAFQGAAVCAPPLRWTSALIERRYKDHQRHPCNRRFNISGRYQTFRPNFFSNSASEIWIIVGRPCGQQ
jgi:hypothetical protein